MNLLLLFLLSVSTIAIDATLIIASIPFTMQWWGEDLPADLSFRWTIARRHSIVWEIITSHRVGETVTKTKENYGP